MPTAECRAVAKSALPLQDMPRSVRCLEMRVPPLLLLLIFAAIMWAASGRLPVSIPRPAVFLGVLAGIGTYICLSGVIAFRAARTTVNPTNPATVSSLVDTGIYGWTRNPMYLGFVLILFGWACWLGDALVWPLPLLYMLWLDVLQIRPEERFLRKKFGDAFADYCKRVRRWV